MGANLSKALSKMFGSKEMRILMLGLDAAGKTSRFSLENDVVFQYINTYFFLLQLSFTS
jgi:hypothetical protein